MENKVDAPEEYKIEFIMPNVIYINDGERIAFYTLSLVHCSNRTAIIGKSMHIIKFPQLSGYPVNEEMDLVHHICEAYIAQQLKVGRAFSGAYEYDYHIRRWVIKFTLVGVR